MDRRAFIGAGAIGTAAASGIVTPGKAASPESPRTGPVPIPDMEDYVARVDAGMARIGRWSPTAAVSTWPGDRAETDALVRGALQSLYMTGMFGDLPIAAQIHSGMQDRMWAALPLINDTLEGMERSLAAQTPAQLETVRQVLLRPADPGKQITDALVHEAELSGVSEVRRRQLRALMNRALWRLKHQPPALLVDEYLDKVQRLADSDVDSAARQRWLASKVAEQVFWDERFRNADPDQVLLAIGATTGSAATRSKRDARIWRGARTMGIGLIAGSVAALLIAYTQDASVVVGLGLGTAGAIFFLVGLIILIVGLLTEQEKPQPADSLPPADSIPPS